MTKCPLLVILMLLASGLGYVWITSHVDDPPQIEAMAQLWVPDTVTVARGEPQADTTADKKPVRPTIERPSEASPSVRLIGRIVNIDGKGLASIKIWLRTLRSADRRFILRHAMTDVKGRFVLDHLDPDGAYSLFTEATAEYPGYSLDGFTLDSLPEQFEIKLASLDLVDVEGTVVDVEHAPVANFRLTIDSLDTDYPSRTVKSDASGYFRIEAFPVGELKIYTATPEYFRILGLRTRAEEYRNMTLVIDRGHYRLAGRILDERGLPIVYARVTLNSVIVDKEYHSHTYRTRLTDASGRFEFAGLGGITHTVGVYANGYSRHIENHEFQSFFDRLEIRLRR